jgi:hypothetical protein
MATNLRTIAQNLKSKKWQYEIDWQSQTIITGIRTSYIPQLLIFIILKDRGRYLQILVPHLCQLKENVFKGIAYQTLLQISHSKPLIRFASDPEDGQIYASVELPLEDAQLTSQQFNRCLDDLVILIDLETMPRLNSVLATGKDIGGADQIEYLYQGMMNDRFEVSFDFRRGAEALLMRATLADIQWLKNQIKQRYP